MILASSPVLGEHRGQRLLPNFLQLLSLEQARPQIVNFCFLSLNDRLEFLAFLHHLKLEGLFLKRARNLIFASSEEAPLLNYF